ncbi:MAG: hypothetical protein RIG82_06020 [Phycisphaeraceae bacterium]
MVRHTLPSSEALAPLFALGLSLVVHIAIFIGGTATTSTAAPERFLPPPVPDDLIEPGDTEPSPARVAWISYDTYQDLKARRSVTQQPAVQATANPQDQAPAELTPTAPSPGQPSPRATAQQPLAEAQSAPSPEPREAPEAGESPPEQGQTERFLAGGPLIPQLLSPQTPPQPESTPQPAGGAITGPDRPTSIPLDTREVPPTSIKGQLEVQPGKVLAREGLIIDTVVPRYTIAARTTLPQRNPIVRITFGLDGKPTEVHWVRTSGLPIHDGPIERALYLWRAKGPMIDDAIKPLTVEIKILLLREAD